MKAYWDAFRGREVRVKAYWDAFRGREVWVKAHWDTFRGREAWVKGKKRRRLCLPLPRIREPYRYTYDFLRHHHPRLWIGHAHAAT